MKFAKLIGKMREMGISQEALAKEIGISQTSLNRKLNGHAQFVFEEINRICIALDIKSSNIVDYFFNDVIRNRI